MRTFYEPTAFNPVVFAFVGSPWGLLAVWLVLINLITFFIFGVDKLKAKRQGARRIRERTLFLLAAVGGSIGAWLGMKVWRHKTLHKSFRFGIPAIFILQLVISLGLYVFFNFIR